jgi:hypothetical protein
MFVKSNTGQVGALLEEIKKLREGNKAGSAELAAIRAESAELQALLMRVQIQLNSAKAAVLKARKRQKNSVERANRFKLKAAKNSDVVG